MSSKRLSNKEFQKFLQALFANDKVKVKYSNPDAWRGHQNSKQKLQTHSKSG